MTMHKQQQVELVIHPQMYDFLSKGDLNLIERLVKKCKGEISFKRNDELHLNGFEFYSLADGQKIEW